MKSIIFCVLVLFITNCGDQKKEAVCKTAISDNDIVEVLTENQNDNVHFYIGCNLEVTPTNNNIMQ